jgi:hypothetical protein
MIRWHGDLSKSQKSTGVAMENDTSLDLALFPIELSN